MNFWFPALWILLGLILGACSQGQQPVQSTTSGSGAPLEPTFQQETLPNLSTSLSDLYRGWVSGNYTEESLPEASGLVFSDSRVKVTLIMRDEASTQQALQRIPDMGGEILYSFETWIDAWVPVEALKDVAALPGVSLVREPVEVSPNNNP